MLTTETITSNTCSLDYNHYQIYLVFLHFVLASLNLPLFNFPYLFSTILVNVFYASLTYYTVHQFSHTPLALYTTHMNTHNNFNTSRF